MTPHALAIHNPAQDRSAAAVQDYRDGLSIDDILRRHRIGGGTLMRLIRLAKVPQRGKHVYKPQAIDPAKASEIAQSYRDGLKTDDILSRHKIGTSTLHKALRAHGVKLRGRSNLHWTVDADPAAAKAVEMIRAGAQQKDVCAKLGIGRHRIRRIIKAAIPETQRAEIRSRRAKRALGGESRRRLLAVPASQWDAWRAAGVSLSRLAQEIGVARDTLQSFAEERGIELPVYVHPPGKMGRRVPKAPRHLAPVATRQAGPAWTWFDYAKQCDLEFSTPHFLRQAPVIKAWLEANGVKP